VLFYSEGKRRGGQSGSKPFRLRGGEDDVREEGEFKLYLNPKVVKGKGKNGRMSENLSGRKERGAGACY